MDKTGVCFNIEVYKILPLNLSSMVNTIPFIFMPYLRNPHDVIIFLKNVLLFYIKSNKLMIGLCSPKSGLQIYCSFIYFHPCTYFTTQVKISYFLGQYVSLLTHWPASNIGMCWWSFITAFYRMSGVLH